MNKQTVQPSKLLDGSSEFVLTYEDKEGDWMLVGDVPWGYTYLTHTTHSNTHTHTHTRMIDKKNK